MLFRSRMTAIVIPLVAVGLALLTSQVSVGLTHFSGNPPKPVPKPSTQTVNHVKLDFRILGFGEKAGKLTITPGHPGCQFQKIMIHFPKGSTVKALNDHLPELTVTSLRSDRDCSFKIVIEEPGLAPRVAMRGLLLKPQTTPKSVPKQKLNCYLSTPTVALREQPRG